MDLAGLAVPTISQNLVSVLGSDGFWVGDAAVLEVGESGALIDNTTLLLAELVLLAVGRIPDVVGEEVGGSQEDNEPEWPCVLGRVVVCNVECAVAVREGHASHVPEDEHEAKLLVVHVPTTVLVCRRDSLECTELTK